MFCFLHQTHDPETASGYFDIYGIREVMANWEMLVGLYKIVSLACTCGVKLGSAKDGTSQNSPTCIKKKKKKREKEKRERAAL